MTRTADALQSGTRTLLTEIDLPNLDGSLSAGIYCTVELKIPRRTPSFVVPAEAIIFNRNGLQVAVVDHGKAEIRKVTVTRDLGTQVEVGAGVKAGDQVILAVPPPKSSVNSRRWVCFHGRSLSSPTLPPSP